MATSKLNPSLPTKAKTLMALKSALDHCHPPPK